MPPFWHWEWRGIWNKSWCGEALGECEPIKGQRCPVGCLGLGMAPQGRIGFLGSGNSRVTQAAEMSWAVNSVCLKSAPAPVQPTLGSKSKHIVLFRGQWPLKRVHSAVLDKMTHLGSADSAFIHISSLGEGRSFYPTLLSSTWALLSQSQALPEEAKFGLLLLGLWLRTGCGWPKWLQKWGFERKHLCIVVV